MLMTATRISEPSASALRTRQAAEEREALQDYQILFERHRDAVLRLVRRASAGRSGHASAWELKEAEEAAATLKATFATLERIVAEIGAGER